MKKLISVILILCMACMLIPAIAEEDVTGEWYVQTLKQGEQEFNAADLGMTIKMVLNADGTGSFENPGQDAIDATWTMDGDIITLTAQDSSISGTVSDGSIVMSDPNSGAEMLLTRDAVEIISFGEVRTDAAAEEFYGEWVPTAIGTQGKIISLNTYAEMTSDTMPSLTISADSLKFSEDGMVGTVMNLVTFIPEYADGAITADAANASVKLELLDDGTLQASLNTSSLLILYMTRVEAAEEEPAA